MKEKKYLNFPVYLLKKFMIFPEKCLNNILHYALYSRISITEISDSLEQMKTLASYYMINLDNPSYALEKGKELFNNKIKGYPMVGLNIVIYFDFINNFKSEFDKICLLGFLAIKSILQQKPYCKITNGYWLARMNGQSKSCNIDLLSPEIRKYANEYQLRKIKNALADGWKLKTYSRYNRGFYVSFKLTYLELIIQAEKQKVAYKDKIRKLEKEKLYLEALSQLKTQR